jgi:hypothetical protein
VEALTILTGTAEALLRLAVFALAGLLWGASVYEPRGRPPQRARVAGASAALALIVAGAWAGLPLGPWLVAAGVGLLALGVTAELRGLARLFTRRARS